MKSNSGLTLIETLIAVAMLAILASIAAPILPTIGRSARVDGVASELAEVFKLARTEASRRSVPVYLSSSDQDDSVDSWSAGWFLWADQDKNTSLTGADARVMVKQNTHGRVRITRTDNNLGPVGFGGVTFSDQFKSVDNITFMVCEDDYEVRVQLLPSGNVRVLGPLDAPIVPANDFVCPH